MISNTHVSSVWRRFAPHALLAALTAFAAPRLAAQAGASTVIASGLNYPSGLAVDSLGNIYVGEQQGTIKKIAPNGTVTVAANTNYYYPYGMTCDAADNVYISNYGGNTVSKLTPAGALTTYVTTTYNPIGLGFGPNGDLFVANRSYPSTVQRVTPQGAVSTFVTLPTYPVGMTADSTGNLYVGYTASYISKVTPAGVVSTFLNNVNNSYGLAMAPTGEIVYSEIGTGAVKKATPAGVVTTLATGLSNPWGVGVDSNGNVYVACQGEGTVRRLTTIGIGVNFSAGSHPVASTVQPGIVGGHNWNNVSASSGTDVALNDTTGTATAARLAFDSTGAYAGFSAPSTANAATNTLYRGGLFGNHTPSEVSVTVTGIPYAYYDVYTFASADTSDTSTLSISNGVTTYYYRSDGQSNAGATNLLQTTSTDAANPTTGRAQYQVFRTQSGSSFTLTTGGSINGVISNNLHGIHIVAVSAPPLPAPAISSATTASGTYNTSFSYQITASPTPTSYGASGLPSGLAVNSSTGLISGTPTTVGTFSVNLTATNATGAGGRALTLTINKATATVALDSLSHTYDGSAKNATATTTPAGLSVAFSYTGAALPPVNAGDYGVLGTINHAHYTGSASSTLTIAQAAATITLGNLTQPFDGTARSVTATTSPADLPVTLTYNGSTTAPTAVGTYAVAASINHANYTGTANDTLTITDTVKPVLSLPANLTLEATSANGAVATFAATATDNVDGSIAATTSHASGATFPLGTTTVTVTATDAAGNTATGSFTITVKDTTAPALTLPASFTLEAASAAGTVATFNASATDVVSSAITVTLSQASGTTFALGTTTVNATATDAAGNTATGSFTITVSDTTAPELTVPSNLTREATSASGATATFAATATDAVGATVTTSHASGSTFALGTTTVTVTAKDAANNTTVKTFTVAVVDTTKPVLTLPANITVEATSPAGAVVTFANSDTDLVGVVARTLSKTSGSTFALGTTTVIATATDAAGNTATGTFTVTVKDSTAPTITSLSASSTSLWPANHKLVAITLTAVATDIASTVATKILSVTSNEPDNGLGDGDTAGDIQITGPLTLNLRAERAGNGNGRIYTIVVEAKDASGNTSTKTITVSVPKNQSGK